MVGNLKTVNRKLFIRRCVACGYDGALLKGGRAKHCAFCGCDLSEHPARSYAEMEGLVESMPWPPPFGPLASETRVVTTSRWLTFLVLVGLGIFSLTYLATVALP